MTTKHYQNQRKVALSKLCRDMEKRGYEFKKCIKNTVHFRNTETGKKERVLLDY